MASTDERNETGNLIYDRAKHHFLGNFPSILPMEQAYVHIGMFLGWMLEKGLYSNIFEEEEAHHVIRFKMREISCSILSAIWDGYLGEDLFNEEGNAFSMHYYQSGLYHQDYKSILASSLPSMYHVQDSWENYDLLSAQIEQRYEEWKKNQPKSPSASDEANRRNESGDTEVSPDLPDSLS